MANQMQGALGAVRCARVCGWSNTYGIIMDLPILFCCWTENDDGGASGAWKISPKYGITILKVYTNMSAEWRQAHHIGEIPLYIWC